MKDEIPFLKVESIVLDSTMLTAKDKWLYISIKKFRNRQNKKCCPSLKRIVKYSELSRPTVLRSRRRLRNLNLLTWEDQDGFKKSTRYRFVLENGTSLEKSRALKEFPMVNQETIVDGQIENQPLVNMRTIVDASQKTTTEAGQSNVSGDSPMVNQETINQKNQKKITRDRTPTASRSPSKVELEAWQEKQIEKIMAGITEKDHAEIEEHCGAKAIGCCVMMDQEKPLCHTCNTGQRQYARNRVAWICMKCGKVSGWIHEDTHLCEVCYDNEVGW